VQTTIATYHADVSVVVFFQKFGHKLVKDWHYLLVGFLFKTIGEQIHVFAISLAFFKPFWFDERTVIFRGTRRVATLTGFFRNELWHNLLSSLPKKRGL